jgi:hypothetical protein
MAFWHFCQHSKKSAIHKSQISEKKKKAADYGRFHQDIFSVRQKNIFVSQNVI